MFYLNIAENIVFYKKYYIIELAYSVLIVVYTENSKNFSFIHKKMANLC